MADPNNKPWILVLFEEENSVAIIPNNWLISEKECFFPSDKLTTQELNKICKSRIEPPNTWRSYVIKILGAYDKRETAFVKFKRAINEEELSSSSGAGGTKKKRKIIKNKKYVITDSSSNDESCDKSSDEAEDYEDFPDANILIKEIEQTQNSQRVEIQQTQNSQEVKQQNKKSKGSNNDVPGGVGKGLKNVPITSKSNLGTPSNRLASGISDDGITHKKKLPAARRSNIGTPTSRSFSSCALNEDTQHKNVPTASRTPSNSGLASALNDDLITHKNVSIAPRSDLGTPSSFRNASDDINFQRQVMRNFFVIRSILDTHSENFNVLLKTSTDNETAGFEESEDVQRCLKKLPISADDDLEELETILGNPDNFALFVKQIGRIGGGGLESIVKKIMYFVLANSIGKQYSYQGAKGKRPFKKLLLFKAVKDAVRLHRSCENATETT